MLLTKPIIFSTGTLLGVALCYLTLSLLAPEYDLNVLTVSGKDVSLWLSRNLGNSVYAFLLVMILFVIEIVRFKRLLSEYIECDIILAKPKFSVFVVIQQRAIIWANLFITIGVIATAWGMRDALIFALGDLDANAARDIGAFGILSRLIHGGVLLALTTTVVGGVGGYLMRITTAIIINQPLTAINHKINQTSLNILFEYLNNIDQKLSFTLPLKQVQKND